MLLLLQRAGLQGQTVRQTGQQRGDGIICKALRTERGKVAEGRVVRSLLLPVVRSQL